MPHGDVLPHLRVLVCEPGSLYKTARGQSIWTNKPAQAQVFHIIPLVSIFLSLFLSLD